MYKYKIDNRVENIVMYLVTYGIEVPLRAQGYIKQELKLAFMEGKLKGIKEITKGQELKEGV